MLLRLCNRLNIPTTITSLFSITFETYPRQLRRWLLQECLFIGEYIVNADIYRGWVLFFCVACVIVFCHALFSDPSKRSPGASFMQATLKALASEPAADIRCARKHPTRTLFRAQQLMRKYCCFVRNNQKIIKQIKLNNKIIIR